ncbi:MAG: Rossmann fold nucleotide-binding protein [Micrococcales bacterium]|nr:Rossmann fold nucleotide-binding protein [Micrococcales bacterium]
MDIESIAALRAALADGASLSHLRLQGLDLRGHKDIFDGRTDIEGLVVLGGQFGEGLGRWLVRAGAIVFPPAPHAPVDPYRGSLYEARELYAQLDEAGYNATPDALAYVWMHDPEHAHDTYAAVLRAIHDAAMDDALDDVIDGRAVVGVMGAHQWRRGTAQFASAAALGHRLAQHGALVVTGGGPGAMEAANLGAYATDAAGLEAALTCVSAVPCYTTDLRAWARCAFEATQLARPHGWEGPARSVGIPTWFYGHEPPNVFCDAIAKFFSNALREDGLLAGARNGVIALPGAAGTVQEIFQTVTPLFYALPGAVLPPLVLVGAHHWTVDVPVWPAVQALARGREMAGAVHLVDDLDEAAAIVMP